MSDTGFQPFTDKGGRYVTTKTASVTMNHHGQMNFPASVRQDVFGGCSYVEYLLNESEMKMGIKGYTEAKAPPHAYKIGNDPTKSGSATVEKALEAIGKAPPEEHTMFELHDSDGMAYINVGKLPDLE